jgi:hypothetical protein
MMESGSSSGAEVREGEGVARGVEVGRNAC